MRRKKATPWLYSLPSMILVGIIVLFPIVYTGYPDKYESISLDGV